MEKFSQQGDLNLFLLTIWAYFYDVDKKFWEYPPRQESLLSSKSSQNIVL